MDRFLMKISMENLTREQEIAMVDRFLVEEPLENLEPVCSAQEAAELQRQCRQVRISGELKDYMVRIIHATREHSMTLCGASPRSTIAFVRAAQGFAHGAGKRLCGARGYQGSGGSGAGSSTGA